MLKRKLNYLSLILYSILLPLASHSQDQNCSRTVVWEKPVVSEINGSIFTNFSFVGASYQGINSLPVWNETFFAENISTNMNIENCTFLPLTQDELSLMHAFTDTIPTILKFWSEQVMSRKKIGTYIEILPFIQDKSTGQIMKLSSFQIQFTTKDKALKVANKVYVANSVLSEGNWYKLAVTQTGIYSLTYSDLANMGINPSELDPSKIGIFGRGGTMLPESNGSPRADDLPENYIEVTGQNDGSFDQGDQIIFYAQGPVSWRYNTSQQIWEHTSHLYADTISYFLTTDRGSGYRIPVKQSSVNTETDIVDTYEYYTTYDENNLNLIKSGRQWFAQIFDVIPNRSYSFEIPALAAEGNIKVRSVTAAKSIIASTFQFSIGNQFWTASHSPISTYENSPVATGTTAYKTLQSVSLPLKIDVLYNKTTPSAAGYLDLIDINAQCILKFISGQLDFRNGSSIGASRIAKYRIGNAAGKVRLWEVTDPVRVVSINESIEGNDLTFKLPSDTIRQFVAFDESKFLKPQFVKKIQNQNLHASSGADMIIISPQAFMAQAIRLATFHSTTSDLNVLVLIPETIYNEFSSGTTDITAIRDFMKMLYDKSSEINMPKYLLLFGDASYDYKDKIPGNTNFIPSWQSPESYSPISSLVNDDYYGTLDNNEGNSYSDVIDIGIGRFPVRTYEEAEQAVDKIIHYSHETPATCGDWRNIITFVADDEDYNEFIEQADQMAVNIENNYPDINFNKIYLDSFIQVSSPAGSRYPDVNKAIDQSIDNGCMFINYTGHGGETGWTKEEVLTVNMINNWSNFDNLPVFITGTCEFSRFDDPGRHSAGEYVFTNPKGGGIALFSTTRPTYGTPNFELNKKLYQYALSQPDGQRPRLGDIIMNSKRDKGSNENGRKFVLLGDPALRIGFPALKVLTTSVNGHAPGIGADTLKAFMVVNIEGIVADDQGNLVSDFTGTIFPTVFDKAVTIKTLANDGGAVYSFQVRKNLLYKGKVNVENGHFSFSFIVPKDIAYNYDYGKISYYATDGKRDASGNYSDFIVGGSSELEITDNKGPDISLYMNNMLFRDGGITDQNARLLALLNDENGINTLGNSIGHDITAVLDGNTADPYILNNFYETDINTFKSGYIWFPFSMLSPGEHTLTVKVWDIFNNSSEAQIHFVVHASGEFVITNTYNYPNPFKDFTDIVFEHNQQDVDFSIRAEIYSMAGQLIRTIEQTGPQSGSVSSPLHWDGLSNLGSDVPQGMYVYNIMVTSSNGLYGQTSGKLIYQK